MRRYSITDLRAFVKRANTLERVYVAYDYIEKLTYITRDMYYELMNILFHKEMELEDDKRYFTSDACDYSPSCPWNAPGMSVKDFI